MDTKYLAGEFGQRLARRNIEYTAMAEARATQSPVFHYRVDLEPVFRPFDPCQTFGPPTGSRAAPAGPVPVLASRRLLLPLDGGAAGRSAESLVAALSGCSLMSLQLFCTHRHAHFFVTAPALDLEYVAAALLAAYPGCALVESLDPWQNVPPNEVGALVELCSTQSYSCRIRGQSPWPSFLRLTSDLLDGESLFAQVMVVPVRHAWQRNITGLLDAGGFVGRGVSLVPSDAKPVGEPFFAVAIRFGATSVRLASCLSSFAGTFSAAGVPFAYRDLDDFLKVLSREELHRMLRECGAHAVGQLFSSSELAPLLVLPDHSLVGSVRLDVLDGLLVPDSLRGPGMALGVNTTLGVPTMVYRPALYNQSAWMPGRSGSGKSSHMVHTCRSFALLGEGVGFVDPHRSACFSLLGVLGELPPDRLMFLDFDHADAPVAFNPFAHAREEDIGRLTNEYAHCFTSLLGTEGLHRTLHLLRMGLYPLFVLGRNLASLLVLFARNPEGDALRAEVLRRVSHPGVRRFWETEFFEYGHDAFQPISNRLSALFLDQRTLRTFAQDEHRVDLAAAMDAGMTVIIAPPANFDAASILGGIIIALFIQIAMRRVGTDRARQHFHLFVDEFHRFITSTKSFQTIIDETAKAGLSVTLANQETSQLPSELLKPLLSMPTQLVFGLNMKDARDLAPLFHGHVTPEQLAALRTGEVYARFGRDVVNFTCPPPLIPDQEVITRLRADSFEKYHTKTTPPLAQRQTPRRPATFEEEEPV